ncbi:MAG: pilus assembly protein N-terminal domain-containing protein [Myxococcales bacterium]|nr:pilus assembly protein N-terminal domain-containing protein [Myxococcales bacterium]
MVLGWAAMAWGQPADASVIWLPSATEVAEGAAVQLSYATEALRCRLPGQGIVGAASEQGVPVALGVHQAAVARWLAARGALGVAEPGLGACEGLPVPYAVHAPPHGLAVQVLHPVQLLQADEALHVEAGPTDRWLVVWGPQQGVAALAVEHPAGAPPTLFGVSAEAAEAPDVAVSIPEGGAWVLPVAVTWAVVPDPAVQVHTLAGRVVLIGEQSGLAAGFQGSAEAQPAPFAVEVGVPWRAGTEPAAVVRAGRFRRFRLGQAVQELLVADPTVAEVTPGKRPDLLTIRGLTAGTTHLVVATADQVRRVRLVVQ